MVVVEQQAYSAILIVLELKLNLSLVYLTYRDKESEENVALRNTFQAFGKGKGENVKLNISKFEELGEFNL